MTQGGRDVQESKVNVEEQKATDTSCLASKQASGFLYQGQCDLVAITNLAKCPSCSQDQPSLVEEVGVGGGCLLQGKLTQTHFQVFYSSLLQITSVYHVQISLRFLCTETGSSAQQNVSRTQTLTILNSAKTLEQNCPPCLVAQLAMWTALLTPMSLSLINLNINNKLRHFRNKVSPYQEPPNALKDR